jgi:hypothetical protein
MGWEGEIMSPKFKSAFYRFLRALVTVIIAGLTVKYTGNQYYMVIAPVLQGIDKYIRDSVK